MVCLFFFFFWEYWLNVEKVKRAAKQNDTKFWDMFAMEIQTLIFSWYGDC